MTERQRRAYEAMSPEQRTAVDRIRSTHASPAYRTEEARVREQVRAEFPPLAPDPQAVAAMARIRRERELRGLSLDDVSARTGIDPAALSKLERGEGNPTVGMLNRLAAAVGLRLEWNLVEATSSGRG